MRHTTRTAVLATLLLAVAYTRPGPAWAGATTYTVTKTADTADGTCDADCSLREAISASNSDVPADTIIVPAGTYVRSLTGVPDDDTNAIGDLDVIQSATIMGAGPGSTIIEGNDEVAGGRVLHVLAGATATILGVTIRRGRPCDPMQCVSGGGVRDDGTLSLSNAEVTGNRGFYGAGLDLEGAAKVERVTVWGNIADSGGGGGGINTDGTATLTNVTVSGNQAEGSGGGISMFGAVSLNNVTVTGNTADADADATGDGGGVWNGGAGPGNGFFPRNSILAGNVDASPASTVHHDCSEGGNPTASGGHNLVQANGNCAFDGPEDLSGVDPLLGPLADNGGPTLTHALLEGSPAIDAGGPDCAATDQRGAPRNCDIGAYERVFCHKVVVNRVGTAGKDRLTGTPGSDGLLGGGGKDALAGSGGKDGVCGGPGKDKLKGGGGRDVLDGGPGRDTCAGQGGRDRAKACEEKKSIP